jgi:hypothetical protein
MFVVEYTQYAIILALYTHVNTRLGESLVFFLKGGSYALENIPR